MYIKVSLNYCKDKNMFQTKVVQKIKTQFVFNNFFFYENRAVYEIGKFHPFIGNEGP